MNGNDGYSTHWRAATTATLTGWLHLAATPTFALMALLTGVAGEGAMDMLCPAAHGMSPLDGMPVMYLLMAVFNVAPWLKLASHWWRGGQRPCSWH